jgi:hypothetical protein
MRRLGARVAAVAFPASALVIVGVSELQRNGVEVSDVEAAAATGLLTWLAFIVFGAGEKTDKP